MNREIYDILGKLEGYRHLDNQREISFLTSKLSVLLAEETESQNRKIGLFTKGLVWFTGALIFIGVIQIVMMIMKEA